jgi:outer membrane protein assembly factor BamA
MGLIGATAAAAETESRDATAIFLRFTIDEGARVVLRSETFKADDGAALPYPHAFLLESVTLRPGDPFSPAAVREDGRRLERLLGDAGYPSVSLEPEAARTGDAEALTWVIKTGPRTRLGPMFVRGNFVTRPETVLEQIPLRSGDLLTTTAIERGQRNLGFLQLFNNAAPISFPGKDDKRDVVPMLVQVEERYEQYSVVHFGIGVSTDQKPPDSSFPVGVNLRGGYENRNLLGHGWNIVGTSAYGTSLFRANLTFLDRRFFGTLFRFDTTLNYLQQATVRLGDIRSGGGSIGFSREMYPGVDAGVHYNLRNTTHTEPLIRSQGPDAQLSSIQLATSVGSVSFNVEWLRLDNRLVPTRGFRIDAIAEVALPALSTPLRALPFPVGDDTFVKLGVHSMSVIPLTSWLSLRHGLRFDHGFPLGGAPLLPKVERYFAGGDTTIRGFDLDRARVEQVLFPLFGGVNGVEYRPIGGNLRILQNIDLQFPISPPFYGAVFMDNGVVADSLDGLAAGQFRHGAGVTPLLLKLPIGDLSFSWAWPLDPGPGDTRIGVLHVNIGLLF